MVGSDKPQPCGFLLCPALASRGREYCAVHTPEQVLKRAKQIVCNAFAPGVDHASAANHQMLTALRAIIIDDLDRTV